MLSIDSLQKAGVNTQEGLSRCMNNEQFYFRLIRKVIEGNDVERLKNAVESGDLDTAFSVAHNLKGSTGNLALTPVYEPVSKMTELLRSRTQTDYAPFVDEISKNWQVLSALCRD
jgi:HPt (histidine-containing phosphotransfer) domain-containing protein